MLLIDGCSGGLTPARAALWAGVAAVLLLVLWPVRVTAGPGWLAVRGLLRTRRVRTDALAGAWRVGNVSAALVLKDVYGGRVELAPEILLTNPLVWHLVDAGARRSRERGTLRTGGALLDRIGRLIDAQAGMILRTSGLR
ncbi:hypothetical protein ITX44_38310 [Streptomyces sp. KK5PA1]|uniref:Uncharacterized protein n=1 Tax=Actinacidiphila acididurans TaxID=2784346 RepID=A0ABS2U578_9ACTN|nr:hypothetical protein [Actinacidiphila acididurans]